METRRQPGSRTAGVLGAGLLAALVFLWAPADGATLTSISVTPSNPTLQVGQTQQFTAVGTFDDSTTRSLTPSIPLAAGERHACVVLVDGGVRCWGNNGNGQLGNGTLTSSSTPVAVSSVSTATGVAAGIYHTCARLSGGEVRCWGYNGTGQLGNGTLTNSMTPVPVTGLSTARAVAAGAFHSCAVLADGGVRCWGQNVTGQLGNGTTTDSSTPVPVTGLNTATAIAAGYYHTCALLAGGAVRCWGYNGNGQLGDGTFANSSTPVALLGLPPVIAISAGAFHTCAVLLDGSIRCWGFNGNGQLGNGTTTGSGIPTPVVPTGTAQAKAVGAGAFHTCAVMADGSAQCWGYNGTGQLGNGTLTNSTTPVVVSGLSNAAAIAGGYFHTCALLGDGSASCWGNNGTGQLGNGTLTASTTPVAVSGISSVALLEWSVNDPAVARITPYGVLTALSVGTATVTASAQGAGGDTTVTVIPLPAGLANISSRARVLTGDDILIGGFIIGGTTPKTVMLRARGPSMGGAPFNIAGTLANPAMQLYSGSTVIAQNDDWQTTDPLCGSPATACGDATQISATGMDPCKPNPGQTAAPPGCSSESALLVTLPPGAYTATVSGVSGATGVGLVEVFEADTMTTALLVNISSRARVETGDNVLIGGLIVGGTVPKTVLLRARGPSMGGAPFNIPGVLANPKIEVYSGATVIARNDDWQTTDPLCLSPATACGNAAQITATGMDPCQPNPGQTIAPPDCALESAVLVTVPPGAYTAIVSGGTGVGLVEVFEAP